MHFTHKSGEEMAFHACKMPWISTWLSSCEIEILQTNGLYSAYSCEILYILKKYKYSLVCENRNNFEEKEIVPKNKQRETYWQYTVILNNVFLPTEVVLSFISHKEI